MPADIPGESPLAPIASSSGLCQDAKDEAFNQQLLYRTSSLPKPANPAEAPLSCDVFKTFTNQSRDNTPDAHPAGVRTLGYEHAPTATKDELRSSGQAAVNSVEAPPDVDDLFAFLESVEDMNLDEFAGSENGQQCHFVNLQAEIHSKRYFSPCSFSGPCSSLGSLTALKRLGSLHILYEYLYDWRRALPSETNTLDKEDICSRLDRYIEFVTWAIETAFRDTLTELVGLAERSASAPDHKELILRRALKAIERFENVAKKRGLVEGSKKIHSTILRHLIVIAEGQDDVVEMAHCQEELCVLSSLDQSSSGVDLNEMLAHCLQNAAHLACDLLRDLDMPTEARDTLAFTRGTSLPTAQRAMHARFEEVAKILLERTNTEPPPIPDILGRSVAHVAVETGSMKLLPFLLKRNPELLEGVDKIKRTPLLIAASRGDLAAFDILVAAGANIGARDLASRTALNHACASGNFAMVKRLLEKGADINDDTFGVAPPLCEAAWGGHYDVCLLLLEHGDCANQLARAADLASANNHFRVAHLLHQNAIVQPVSQLTLLRAALSRSRDGKSRSRDGSSVRTTPSLFPAPLTNNGWCNRAPDWETRSILEISSESSHCSSLDQMHDTLDFGMGCSASNLFGGKR
jgi:hypothetical protein